MMTTSPELTILDVGHGKCVVLQDSEGTFIFDAGGGSALLEFLTEHGVNQIDGIVISHADADHISGLSALLAAPDIQVDRIYINSDSIKDTDAWWDLRYSVEDAANRGETKIIGAVPGTSEGFERGDIKIEILAPGPGVALAGPGGVDLQKRRIDANTMSVVVLISLQDDPQILLTGDLDGVGLDNFLEHHPSPRARVLVFPHHGGRPSNADPEEFASRICVAVQPDMVVFSIGRGKYSTPRPEIVHEVRRVLPAVHIACTQLSNHCASEIPSLPPTHLSTIFARGRNQRACCAGSINLVLSTDSIKYLPTRSSHLAFVQGNALTALCI